MSNFINIDSTEESIIISIDKKKLLYRIKYIPQLSDKFSKGIIAIIDEDIFIRDLINAISWENYAKESSISNMLEEAVIDLIDTGSKGIDYD